VESYFIQSPHTEERPGDYHKKHKAIVQKRCDPVAELERYRKDLQEECAKLGLAAPRLEQYNPRDFKEEMPESVFPLNAIKDQQQEVQEEIETNNELLLELETEQEQQQHHNVTKVPSYLPRRSSGHATKASTIHPAFSPKIAIKEECLPLYRQEPLHKRRPFDDRTGRIGWVHIHTINGKVHKISVEDFIGEHAYTYTYHRFLKKAEPQDISHLPQELQDHRAALKTSDPRELYAFEAEFFYDIRLNQVMQQTIDVEWVFQDPDIHHYLAQVKFLDGMVDGYTEAEAEALKVWLKENGVTEMLSLFTEKILQYRPQQPFTYSQLWEIFQELRDC
jgi:hypothetical protein